MVKTEELLKKLITIGVSLSSIRDLDQLLDRILLESRKITQADSGSIYLVEKKNLIFKISQNDTLSHRWGEERFRQSFSSFMLEITEESMAGYVAKYGRIINIPDVYEMPEQLPFRHNRSFDEKNEYRTQSMLTIPMKNNVDQVIGVLQLINAKKGREVIAFESELHPILEALASQAAVAMENALLHQRLKEAHLDTVLKLGVAAEYRDRETANHIKRVSLYSGVLAGNLGWRGDQLELIIHAAPMHDVGKVGIPDSVLQKPGRLTPAERQIMEYHTIIGAAILRHSNDELLKISRIVALTHHEKWNGQGYPQGLKAANIPIEGRITAIADVYDALSAKRVYKDAFPEEKVLAIMTEERGQHFDPDLIDIFLANLDEFRHIRTEYHDEKAELDFIEELAKIDLGELSEDG